MKREELYVMSHPEPKGHRRMSLQNRAAQFAPFAALNGYDEQIVEAERTTDPAMCVAEDLCEEIDRKLQLLFSDSRPERVEITFFIPDRLKNGGRYITACGCVTSVNSHLRTVTVNCIEIPVDSITNVLIY